MRRLFPVVALLLCALLGACATARTVSGPNGTRQTTVENPGATIFNLIKFFKE